MSGDIYYICSICVHFVYISFYRSLSMFICATKQLFCMSAFAHCVHCVPPFSAGPETKLDVRLVGGSDGSQGRVEIGFYGAWGRVCDDYWDIQEARVVCLMLGYPYAIAAIGPSTFGDGHGRVWVDNVWCKGEESTLLDCPLQGWSVQSCKQGDYAGVICSS